MCYKNWMGILAALAIAAMPASVSAGQKTFQLIHWTKALQTENKRVDNQGSASVFGVSVGAHVDRISAQAHANKKIKNFFSYLRTYKKASDASIRQCQANYETLKSAVQHNQLAAIGVGVGNSTRQVNTPAASLLNIFGKDFVGIGIIPRLNAINKLTGIFIIIRTA